MEENYNLRSKIFEKVSKEKELLDIDDLHLVVGLGVDNDNVSYAVAPDCLSNRRRVRNLSVKRIGFKGTDNAESELLLGRKVFDRDCVGGNTGLREV